MNEKIYALPESLRQSFMAYLSQRPYREVAEGMAALSMLKEIAPPVQDEAMRNQFHDISAIHKE